MSSPRSMEQSVRDEDRVVARFTHSRLADAAMCDDLRGSSRWAMDSLRTYLETGVGLPDEASASGGKL